MHGVAVVERDVAGARLELGAPRRAGVARIDGRAALVPGARQEAKLARLGGGGRQVGRDDQHRAHHRVAAHPAVPVPRDVGEALGHVRVLVDDAHAFLGAALAAVLEGDVGELLEGDDARVARDRAQPRPGPGAGHAAQDLLARRVLAPPRELVALARLAAQLHGLPEEGLDLVGAEDVAHQQVARGAQEVRHVVAVVRERERRFRVERGAVAVREGHVLGVVDRATAEEAAQRRLPLHPQDRLAARAARAPAVEEARRGVELVHHVLPDLVGELDHRVRVVVALHQLDPPVRRAVRPGTALVDPEGEAAQPCGGPGGSCAPSVRQEPRQRLAVVGVEVERGEGRHALSRVPVASIRPRAQVSKTLGVVT